MAKDILKYQCPSCGGPVHFNTSTQMLLCEHCGSEYKQSDFENNAENETVQNSQPIDWKTKSAVKEHEVIEMQSGFNCTSCGAQVVCDGNTAATECMYCGNPIVLANNVSGMLKPDLILPFSIDKQQAQEKLRGFYKNKILLPSAFKKENRIKKITGMYVPFWLFSGKSEANMLFKAGKEKTHTSGGYRVTETSHYDVYRSGNLSFSRIPVDASKKMEDNYMDGLEPYDYTALTEFSPPYMAGFFADKYDMDVKECKQRAINRVASSTKQALRTTIMGYDYAIEQDEQTAIEFVDDDIKYALLPVWVLNTKYKGKMYHFAVNGQTGKVSGDLPIDKLKKRLLHFALIVIIFTIFALL